MAPKPGLQVVSSTSPTVEPASTSLDNTLADDAMPLDEEIWHEQATPKQMDGLAGDVEASEPPAKLMKLIAAAAVLGIAAIGLIVLQFSGGPSASNADQNLLVNAAEAAPSESASREPLVQDQNATEQEPTSALVAQIAAGTLAALRNGQSTGADTAAVGVSAHAGPSPISNQGSAAGNGLYSMVLVALEQGQSVSYIDRMVNEAYQANEVTVPDLLLTATGEVNTKALLALFGTN